MGSLKKWANDHAEALAVIVPLGVFLAGFGFAIWDTSSNNEQPVKDDWIPPVKKDWYRPSED